MNRKVKGQLTPDKCDFRFSSGLLKFKGKHFKEGSEWSSDNMHQKIHVQSSKCDWHILAKDDEIKVDTFHSPNTLSVQSELKGIKSALESDKCDFRIQTELAAVKKFKLDTQGPGSTINVSSSKCDWKVQAIGGFTKKTPKFDANLSSSKCDFILNIQFGVAGGKNIHLSAIQSDKCDFRIKETNIDEIR